MQDILKLYSHAVCDYADLIDAKLYPVAFPECQVGVDSYSVSVCMHNR